MAGLIRLLTVLTVLAATLGGLEATWPSWLEDLARGRLTPRRGGMEVVARGRELDVIAARMEARAKLIARLGAGELTLLETAARFDELNRTPEDMPDRGWRMLEGRCDGERLCRQVLVWAETRLESEPRREEKLRAWEAELAAHIARHGRVVLPR